MNEKCCGISGRLFGHNFRARYDTDNTSRSTSSKDDTAQQLKEALDAYYKRCVFIDNDQIQFITEGFCGIGNNDSAEKEIYVHDVCIRCGLVIKRQ